MKDWNSIFLLLAAGQGILLSLALIISNLKKKNSSFFLGLVLFVFAIELLNAWAIRLEYHSEKGNFPFWILGSYLFVPSSIWFFVKTSTDSDFKVRRTHILFFLPALIEVIVEFLSFYYEHATGKSLQLIRNNFWFAFTEVVPILLMLLALGYFGNQIKSLVFKSVSKRLSAEVMKLCVFFILFSFLALLWIGEAIFQLHLFTIIEIVLTIVLFILGYIVYFKPMFFYSPLTIKSKQEEAFVHYNEEFEIVRLKSLFENDKIHLRPRLTVKELAVKMNLPERYISFLLNNRENTNFSTFVNEYRVKEFLSRINDPKESHKNLLGVALDSGFSSKSSFNQIFKTITGRTPSEYLSKPESSPKS